jgi:hypothetical protein
MSEQDFQKKRSIGKRTTKRNRTISTSRKSWFHLGHDGRLHVVNQKFGEPAIGHVTLTRAEFEQFRNFYERSEPCRRLRK